MNFKPDIKIDSQVWITHLQFVLQTISIMYPLHPNDVTKKNTMTPFIIYRCFSPTIPLVIIFPNYLMNSQCPRILVQENPL